MDFWPFNFFSAAHELIVQLVKFSDCWVAHSRTDSFSHVFEPSSWSCVVAITAMKIQTKVASPGIHASLLCCVCVENPVFVWEVQLPLRYGKHQYLVGGKSNIKCFKGFSSPVQIYRHLPGSQPAVDWSVQGPCDDFGRWLQVAIAVVYNFLQIAFLNVRTGDYQLQSQ